MALSAQEGTAARRRAISSEAEELYTRAKGRLVAGDEDAARSFLTVPTFVRGTKASHGVQIAEDGTRNSKSV